MASWPCKLGCMHQPGYSPESVPSFSNDFGPIITKDGSALTPLIDESGCIYATKRTAIIKMTNEGMHVWVVEAQDRGPFSGVPALLDGCLFASTEKGWAMSINAQTGKENWCKRVCKGGCVADWSAVAADEGTMVLAGKESEENADKRFSTDVYALDAKTGQERWKVKVRTGVICFVPSIVSGTVVFQSINGEVVCLKLADGAQNWMTKPSGQVSTAGAVVCKELGMVYSAGNKRGKRDWCLPNGGKGALRAFDLKTGELKWETELGYEACAPPAVAPKGAEGRFMVIVPCGANPGTWRNAAGDIWRAGVLGLDAKDGTEIWRSDEWVHYGRGPGGTSERPPFLDFAAVALSNPVVTASGSVFIAWQGCFMRELDVETGQVRGLLCGIPTFQASAAVAPGLLVVCSLRYMYIYHNRAGKGQVLRELAAPFAETGYEHFWPHKCTTPNQLTTPTDLTKPAWVAADVNKHAARLPAGYYEMTPVVDSQRNAYIATNLGHVLVVRADGSLRGRVNCGPRLSNLCLHEQHLYVCNGAGFCMKVDIETLEVVWNRQFCSFTSKGCWSPLVCPKHGVVLVAGALNAFQLMVMGEVSGIFALNVGDGCPRWKREIYHSTSHFSPCADEDKDLVFLADDSGGIYCFKISDSTTVWEQQADAEENSRSFTTGHCALGPNGMVYNACNLAPTAQNLHGVWNKGAGSGGKVRAYDVDTGDHMWTRTFALECNKAPTVVTTAKGKHVVIIAQGSMSDIPAPDHALEDGDSRWPRGDAWESCVSGHDAETGEELWQCALPVWRQYTARGVYEGDKFPAQCFGNPTGATGKVYVVHWSGILYCLDAGSGVVISKSDVNAASLSAVVVLPGLILAPTAHAVVAYRDASLEQEWLQKATAAGDKRADPKLWSSSRQNFTQADEDAITCSLGVSPATNCRKAKYKAVPTPNAAFSEQTWNARCRRLRANDEAQRGKPEEKPSPAPAAPAPAATPANSESAEQPPAVAAKPAKAAGAQPGKVKEEVFWTVVGGGKAGGITVRSEQALKSAELGRLGNGAKVRELALHGERLRYVKVSGEGPDTGWVSLKFKNTTLLQRA